jgi:hypothetical protein
MSEVMRRMEIELDVRKERIRQLEDRLEKAQAALKPFAEVGAYLHGNEFNELFSTGGLRISMEDLKNTVIAWDALEQP